MIRCKGYCHSLNGGTWSVTRNPQYRTECLSDESRSDVSASHSDLGSDIRATKYLEGGRPTTNMKKGWLCRNSYDEKNQEIAPVMMIQQRCSRTRDDPDPVMFQI